MLVGVVFAAAAGALLWAWLRRSWELLLYAGGALLGAVVLFEVGSPWVAGKSLAAASPALYKRFRTRFPRLRPTPGSVRPPA